MAPGFAQQRLVGTALVVGMTLYVLTVAVVLSTNEGKGLAGEPIPSLDQLTIFVGFASAVIGLSLRRFLRPRDEQKEPGGRRAAWFRATIAPIAALEGGALFATTVWLLNGKAIPPLVVALVLIALAILLLPFRDPEEGAGS